MKKSFWFGLVGGSLGGVLSSIFSPKLIAWYFEPPVEIGVNCRPAVEWAMDHLQWAQFWGIGGGLAIALILYFWLFRNSDKSRL